MKVYIQFKNGDELSEKMTVEEARERPEANIIARKLAESVARDL